MPILRAAFARVEVEQALVFDARDQGATALTAPIWPVPYWCSNLPMATSITKSYNGRALTTRRASVVAALDAQVAGVEVVVCHGHEGLCLERGIKAEGV